MNYGQRIIEYASKLKERYNKVDELLHYPEVTADLKLFLRLSKEHTFLSQIVLRLNEYERLNQEIIELNREQIDSEDKSVYNLIINENENKCQELIDEIDSILKQNEGEQEDALIEINSNSSNSLACQILDMYLAYAQKEGLQFDIIRINKTDNSLVKSALICVNGCYETLKNETGIHQDETGAMIVSVYVCKKIEQEEYETGEKDIRIDLFHSSGAGGQNVNKVQSAVRITHLKTGVVVVCQDERSQLKNKQRAMDNLKIKLSELSKKNARIKAEQAKKQAKKQIEAKLRIYNFTLNKVIDIKTDIRLDLKEALSGNIDSFLKKEVIGE